MNKINKYPISTNIDYMFLKLREQEAPEIVGKQLLDFGYGYSLREETYKLKRHHGIDEIKVYIIDIPGTHSTAFFYRITTNPTVESFLHQHFRITRVDFAIDVTVDKCYEKDHIIELTRSAIMENKDPNRIFTLGGGEEKFEYEPYIGFYSSKVRKISEKNSKEERGFKVYAKKASNRLRYEIIYRGTRCRALANFFENKQYGQFLNFLAEKLHQEISSYNTFYFAEDNKRALSFIKLTLIPQITSGFFDLKIAKTIVESGQKAKGLAKQNIRTLPYIQPLLGLSSNERLPFFFPAQINNIDAILLFYFLFAKLCEEKRTYYPHSITKKLKDPYKICCPFSEILDKLFNLVDRGSSVNRIKKAAIALQSCSFFFDSIDKKTSVVFFPFSSVAINTKQICIIFNDNLLKFIPAYLFQVQSHGFSEVFIEYQKLSDTSKKLPEYLPSIFFNFILLASNIPEAPGFNLGALFKPTSNQEKPLDHRKKLRIWCCLNACFNVISKYRPDILFYIEENKKEEKKLVKNTSLPNSGYLYIQSLHRLHFVSYIGKN